MAGAIQPIAFPNFSDKVPTTFSTTDGASQNIYQMPVGTILTGTDGNQYVLCSVTAATVAANTATCTVSNSFVCTSATGGTYVSPPVALVSGDRAWFYKPFTA